MTPKAEREISKMVKTIGVCYHCEQCEGETCPNRRIEEHYCDVCGKRLDDDEIYIVDIDEVCEDCLNKFYLNDDD